MIRISLIFAAVFATTLIDSVAANGQTSTKRGVAIKGAKGLTGSLGGTIRVESKSPSRHQIPTAGAVFTTDLDLDLDGSGVVPNGGVGRWKFHYDLGRALSPETPKLPMQIRLDDPLVHHWMQYGWHRDPHAPPGAGCWSAAKSSGLLLPLPAGADVKMTLVCQPLVFPSSPVQAVSVSLNGHSVGRIVLREGHQSYDVTLPGSKLHEYPNRIRFDYAFVRRLRGTPPSSKDNRWVSVLWHAIRFARLEPAAAGEMAETDRPNSVQQP